ncbi:MAG: hypothetical protein JRE40_10120 [Deltaproteobacteria bacterium]|nr:hypothetical protein [Deltaproteobacteria bacterium]
MEARAFRPAPQPPPYIGKCPLCKRVNTMVFTGKFTQHGDRIYRCAACGSLCGAPSDYAWCELYDEPLIKDVFWTPCLKCPLRRPVADGRPGHGVCVHFRKERWYGDISALSAQVERAMRRVLKFGPGGEI